MAEEEKVEEKSALEIVKDNLDNADVDGLKIGMKLLLDLSDGKLVDDSHKKTIEVIISLAGTIKRFKDKLNDV